MTTQLLFRDDAYLREAEATVLAHTPEGGIVLDASIFYATAGGQPGDSGMIVWSGGRMPIATAVKVEGGLIALRSRNCCCKWTIAAAVRPMTSSPDVSLSRRCTMPGRCWPVGS